MRVSQPPAPSSIDLSDLPARVAEAVARMAALCRQQLGSEPCPESFEETERRVRERAPAMVPRSCAPLSRTGMMVCPGLSGTGRAGSGRRRR